jgi:Peptidase family M23
MIKKAFYLAILLFIVNTVFSQTFYLPINCYDRTEISTIQLTAIGNFGEKRKMRPGIPAHFHTGIDIKRPNPNYEDEPIFAIGEGRVISLRNDGPYAQIIIEHYHNGNLFWVEYEHIAGIEIGVGDFVDENMVISRFMNKSELNKYGWQFDHFHFEILKEQPLRAKPRESQAQHFFSTYNLVCYTYDDLNSKYYDPLQFLKELIY